MTALALVDREAAYMTLYLVGALLLLLGSAAGLGGGGVAGRAFGGGEEHREDLAQRVAGLPQNMLLLLAGAILIGIGVLLNLA
jgi:hypothetical protein